jgi:hypothetical protein
MASAADGASFSNIAATTSAFTLEGGKYSAAAIATWSAGSVKLQALGPDGSTYLSVSSPTDFSANGFAAAVDLPPGQYRFTIATATAVYASVWRVPT